MTDAWPTGSGSRGPSGGAGRQGAWPIGPSHLGVLVLGVALGACTTEAPLLHPQPLPSLGRGRTSAPRVRRLERAGDQLLGQLAAGRSGDFRLENDLLAVVVEGLGGARPGSVIDAGRRTRTGTHDALRLLSPLVGRKTMRRPLFSRVDRREAGDMAILRLTGRDADEPRAAIIVEHCLQAGSPFLLLRTRVVNQSSRALTGYQVADAVDWGEAVPFAPGIGRYPRGRPALPWIGAWTDRVAYAYLRRRGELAADLSEPIGTYLLETLEIPPRGEAVVERLLAVGDGGAALGALLPTIFRARDLPVGALHASLGDGQGTRLAGVPLEILERGRPLAMGRTDGGGRATLHLPAGSYQLRAAAPDRSSPALTITLGAPGAAEVKLTASAPARLIYDVREEEEATRQPVRLSIAGIEGTPDPWLGPHQAPAAARNLLTPTGQGSLPLPPGRYRVTASRGPTRTIQTGEVTVRPLAGGSFAARLRRVVDTTGYLAVDLGQHTIRSPGCAVASSERLLASRAEALDAVLSADLGQAVDLAADAGAGGTAILALVGLSWHTPTLGPFTIFPVPPSRHPLGREALATLLAGGPLLQLDRARWRGRGLLARTGFSADRPDPSLVPEAVAALRLLDGEHPEDFDGLLADWLALLRAGRRLTATAASSSRAIFGGEAGYPRTYVQLPDAATSPQPSPGERLIAALRQGRALISSGPFLRLTVEGQGPGATVSPPPGPRGRRSAPRTVTVRVVVSAPAWIDLEALTLLLDGAPWEKPLPIPGRADGVRLDRTLQLPVTRDGFLVALVRGRGTLAPVVNAIGAPLPPLALTNPVWIDADGDGVVQPVSRAAPASRR